MGSLAAASLKPLRGGATEAVLDSQLFQSLLADALDSGQVQIALRRALETEGAEHVVEMLFESGLVDEFVDRLVADGAAWVLINAVLASNEAEQLVSKGALWGLIDKALQSEGAGALVADETLWTLIDKALTGDGARRLVESGALWTLISAALAGEGAGELVENPALWTLVDRALTSDGARQLMNSAALWGVIDGALQSAAAQQLVENPALWTLINRALQTAGASQLVNSRALWTLIDQALTSDGAGRLVNSGALWKLIDQALQSDGADQFVTNPALWKLITGALESGGADALLNSPPLWSLIDTAIASDGAERMIHSPALWTLIGKALESENADGLVTRLFDSGFADQFIDRLVTNKAVWRLVDEIAASPAVTAAVTQQSLGFADQVGGELRARARQADDWILRKARRNRDGDGTSRSGNESPGTAAGDAQASPAVPPLIGSDTAVPATPRAGAATLVPAAPLTGDTSIPAVPATGADGVPAEQRYIGVVARTLGFIVDATLICVPALIVEFAAALIVTVAHLPSSWKSVMVVVGGIAFALWALVYFVAFWTTTGQTPGARIMQFRVVPRTGDTLKTRRAIVRAIGLVLAAIPLFAGYLSIAIGRKHRGLQDYLARTIVVDAPEQSVADAQRIAAHANRTRTLILSAEATDAPDAHAPHDGDQIALDPVRRNVASSDSGPAGGSGA
jgi:uncharacterized RDD family membrane protein YckC